MSRAWLGKLVLSVILAGSVAGCATRSVSTFPSAATVETSTVAVVVQRAITIRWVGHHSEANRIAVEIAGISQDALRSLADTPPDQTQWPNLFAVYVAPGHESGGDELPPMLGRYEVLQDRIRFEPQFPVQPGLSYRVELQIEKVEKRALAEAGPIVAWFRVPAPVKVPKTVVQHVYPSAGKLPENLLKFYIQFSGPMSRGGIYEHIRLLDAAGHPVELPFLEIDEELWNPELTRLTLFIDPGRVKRGVQPLEEIGPAIEAGRRYTLVIDRNWLDGDGAPLKATFKKRFTAGPPDREPPDAKTWIVKPPKANSGEPVVIRFAEAMDQALAQRVIWVTDSEMRKVEGRVALSDQERQWNFTPETNWKSGRYQIVAGSVTEDLAGNSLGRPFEVDLFETVEDKPVHKTVALPFEVRGR